jgi:hypothetical protein
MNRRPGLLIAVARGVRWGLPWLSVLAISASVAYAAMVAIASGPVAADAVVTNSAAHTPAQALRTAGPVASVTSTASVDRLGSKDACDTAAGRMLYVGLNSWIPAERGAARCPDGIP